MTNMNDYKELLSRIAYCMSEENCDECPLNSDNNFYPCVDKLLKKASDAIEKLSLDVARLEAENFAKEQYIAETIGKVIKERKELKEVNILLKANCDHFKRERDAAIADLRYQSACWNCTKNGKDCHANVPMEQPNVMCGDFEWRGVRCEPYKGEAKMDGDE